MSLRLPEDTTLCQQDNPGLSLMISELLILMGLRGRFADLLILRDIREITDLRSEISEQGAPAVATAMAGGRKVRGME